MAETAKVHYSIGVDQKGKLVEIRIDGKLMNFQRYDRERKSNREIVLKLRFFDPETPTAPPSGPIDACCLVDGDGTLLCWC
jgi:hypothetical protein